MCVCSQLGARMLEWVAMSSSSESSWPWDRTHVSCVSGIGRWIFYHWVTWEAPPKLMKQCTIYLFSMWLLSLKLFYIRHDMTLFSHKKGNLDIILYYLSIKYGRWDLLIVFSSVQFRCTVMSNSLQSHGLQHSRLPCPSPTPELTQTHPLSSPSPPPAPNLSQHQGLFQWVSSSHQVAKVLEFQLQHQSFQWIFRTDFL